MSADSTPPRSSPRTTNLLVVVAAALATVLAASPVSAQVHGGPPGAGPGSGNAGSGNLGSGKPGSGTHGRLLPLLPNGSPIEPSTWREESTESTEILDEGRWSWEVNLVGGSWDRAQGLNSNALEWAHAEVQRGLGGGLQFGAAVESWNRGEVREGDRAQSVLESGYGPTTLDLRRRLTTAGAPGPRACAGVRVRLPGSVDGPGAHVAEGGAFLPVTFSLSPSTHLGTMLEADVVSDALDSGRHVEGVSSLELAHEFTDRFSGRAEVVGVWYGEAGRSFLSVVDMGIAVDPVPHVGLSLGAAGGSSGGTTELGWFGRPSVHP